MELHSKDAKAIIAILDTMAGKQKEAIEGGENLGYALRRERRMRELPNPTTIVNGVILNTERFEEFVAAALSNEITLEAMETAGLAKHLDDGRCQINIASLFDLKGQDNPGKILAKPTRRVA